MKRILQLLTAVMSLSIMGTVQTWAEFSLSSDSAALAAESYPRRMVMEEATATWCGWCPQGIVAIDGLKRDFPDNFLAIAIHGMGIKWRILTNMACRLMVILQPFSIAKVRQWTIRG